MNHDRFAYNDDGPIYVGRILRDPATGELKEIIHIDTANTIHRFTDGALYRSSNGERCAMYGQSSQTSRNEHKRRMNQARLRAQAHKGAA